MQMKRWIFGALTSALFVAGCSGDADFPNSYRSSEALIAAALDAMQEGDREALETLRVSENEYGTLLWDQLPESRHFPLEYVWSVNEHNSQKALDELLPVLSGSSLELIELTFDEPVEEYDGFRLFLGARTRVRRESDGEEAILPLFDGFVERDGRWKLLNFSD
ncbi:MAG: hypothetical protein GEU90_18640 [Gemmatimonas sp.]|nr:hypothetical protein [Gemmatimonas sp.]